MQRALSFDDTPPLDGPLRFFLTAPVFALAAAVLLLWQGEAALVSRWSMSTLALTHLLTLGFLATTMCGALLQILPVVGGVRVVRVELTARITHVALTLGTILLVAGFILSQPVLFRLAAASLGYAFFWLLASVTIGLLRSAPSAAAATINAIRLALLCLVVTASLGVTLAGAFGWALPLPVMQLTDLHAAWGLLGWVGLLVVGVAFQVIPMFQATAIYPRAISSWLPASLLAALAAWSYLAFSRNDVHIVRILPSLLLAGGFAAFALTSLYLLHKRKRPKADPTTLFWRLAMGSLLLCIALYLVPQFSHDAARPLVLGILLIIGFAGSAVSGMLYKIVPFLLWYHLQSNAIERKAVPNIKALLPDHSAEQQFWLHLSALVLLVAAVLLPTVFARPAAIMFGVAALRLWLNLLQAAQAYRRAAKRSASALVPA